ncbi:MAG TPA: bacillithiol system redox-active protein YtxJ [Ferruginibacter sp.]|nr:bacillithiol system redox-active protein YtxJ [Ferruginibacter sp.]HMP21702.1 bacillithiol system redox-active protein YtxJ [Ferruginibacter sp.]
MNWIELNQEDQLEALKELSKSRYQLIFKHSKRCSISSIVKSRLERTEAPPHIDFYFLDLIAHRNISNKIAEDFSVYHESPQVLLIKDGECIYDESHTGINMDDIIATAA